MKSYLDVIPVHFEVVLEPTINQNISGTRLLSEIKRVETNAFYKINKISL